MKIYEITFELRAPNGGVLLPMLPVQKVIALACSETAHGAEDFCRIRFDLGIDWKVTEVKEVS